MTTDCRPGRLTFSCFDERFLERSWHWLRDPEIKRLTLTPDFTREQQLRWFGGLSEKKDYLIWGLLCEGTPIGAVGLKNITRDEAEYWGYIGERDYWGSGLGREMLTFAIERARKIGLIGLYLNVHRDNGRAIGLYNWGGFRTVHENDGVVKMRISLGETNEQ